MNDDELITTVRESVTGVHMTIPEEQIVSRSRTIRARRRIPAAAGALAVAGGTALAVTALVPSGHQPGHPVNARLAAWTVTKQASGLIDVTINQLKNPAGLQATLRADGLPVNVSFSGPALSTSCKPYNNVSKTVLSAVVQLSPSGKSAHFIIDPSGPSHRHRPGHLRQPRGRRPAPQPACARHREPATSRPHRPAGLRPGALQPAVHRVTEPPQQTSRRLSTPGKDRAVTRGPSPLDRAKYDQRSALATVAIQTET